MLYTYNLEISSFEVVGVVTQPPKRRKRKGKEIPSPVGLVAQELEIPVLWPEKVCMNIIHVILFFVLPIIHCPIVFFSISSLYILKTTHTKQIDDMILCI